MTLILLAAIACLKTHAQDNILVKSADKNYRGYTIRLLHASAGTFGFDIIRGKSLIAYQHINPFNGAPIGLSKSDAYKLAKWQVDDIEKAISPKKLSSQQKINAVLVNRIYPPSLGKQLQIKF
jgi:hypothetical protein